MLTENTDNLDAMIREEKRLVAIEFFQEAWNSAMQEGIEPSILAESALVATLTQLREAEGENALTEIIATLPDRAASGHFIANRSLQ